MQNPDDRPATASSETEYLSEQSDAARAAIGGVIADLKNNLQSGWEQATDVHGWIERHPWLAVGAASAAGFAAAAVVTPAPGEALGEKLSGVVRSAMDEFRSAGGQADGEAEAANGASAARPAAVSPWAVLLGPLVDIAQVALQNYLAAYMAGRAAAGATSPPDTATESAAEPAAGPATPGDVESTETNASAWA